MSVQIPEGFEPMPLGKGFVNHIGPYYMRLQPEGHYIYGMQTDVRHGNTNDVLHGGVLFSFADTFIGHVIIHQLQRKCATITLNSQFIAGGRPGVWLEGTARIVRSKRSLAFVETEVAAEDQLLFRGSAIFKLFGPK